MIATVFPLLLGPRKMPVQGTRGTIGSLGCFEPMLYPECLVGLEALWNWRRPKTEVDEVDGRGSAFLKAKLNWDRARFWDADGQPLECPGDLAGRLAKVHVELRQVWLMSPQCGLLLEVTDPQLREAAPQAECPF